MSRSLRAPAACALLLLPLACGSSEPPLSVAGTWTTTPTGVTYVANGSTHHTSMSITMTQDGDELTFEAMTEANGVVWACPKGTISGKTITIPECALTNQFAACQTTATVTGTIDDSTTPWTLTFGAYTCTWSGGASCPVNGVAVAVEPISLAKQ